LNKLADNILYVFGEFLPKICRLRNANITNINPHVRKWVHKAPKWFLSILRGAEERGVSELRLI